MQSSQSSSSLISSTQTSIGAISTQNNSSAVTSTTPVQTNSSPYTNSYFPNLKIVYDSSWKFETFAVESPGYEGYLVDREIKLSKGNNSFRIRSLIVNGGFGCESIDEWNELETFPNGLKKFITPDKTRIQYSNIADCGPSNILVSNFPVSSVPNYVGQSKDGFVVWTYNVILDVDYAPDSQFIKDIDQVLRQSFIG